jgi:hypothetical protein
MSGLSYDSNFQLQRSRVGVIGVFYISFYTLLYLWFYFLICKRGGLYELVSNVYGAGTALFRRLERFLARQKRTQIAHSVHIYPSS